MMSGIYTGLKEQLLDWLLNGGTPTGVVPRVVGVDDGYTFDAEESTIDTALLSAVVGPVDLEGFTFVGGIIDADNLVLVDIPPGPTVYGFVVYFEWAGGSRPVCYINSATDESLPQQIVTGKLNINFNASGICKI